jgi:hypothetical protein
MFLNAINLSRNCLPSGRMHEKIWFIGLPEQGRTRRFPAEYRRRSPRWYLSSLCS